MICRICGEDKPAADFMQFYRMSDEDKAFFANIRRDERGLPYNDVCWLCNGGYKCLQCNNVFPASDYRIGGRFCKHCKSKWRTPAKRAKLAHSSAQRRAK